MDNLSNMPSKVREIKLSYSYAIKPSQLPKVNSSSDAYKVLLQTWNTDKIEYIEEFKILLLNRGNGVLGCCSISVGGQTGTVVDPKVIFGCALKGNAVGIILAHNHPSGNLNPSEADKQLTEKLKQGAKLLDLHILDHLIIIPEGYYSFADEGFI